MGGNALKQYTTTRLSAEDYVVYVEQFEQLFNDVFGFFPVIIKAYRSKESFGDADFLVEREKLPTDWLNILMTQFELSPNQIVENSNVVSIGYKHFQVDLIVTNSSHMDASYVYFSYNDLGNLIGRIGHKLGIKIGHKGLSLVIRPQGLNNTILKEIVLTTNVYEAFEILGLSKKEYCNGFDTLDDIFRFVSSSKYFDPEIYALEHRSATSRIRDKKRATYHAFLNWISDTSPQARYSFQHKSELGGYSIRMPYYETEVLSRWPDIKQVVDDVMCTHKHLERFKIIYNGKLVSEWTGLSGKELGHFMSVIKPHLTQPVIDDWLNTPSLVQIFVRRMMIEHIT